MPALAWTTILYSPIYISHITGIAGIYLQSLLLVEMGSQGLLSRLASNCNPPTSASQVVRITGNSHHAWLNSCIFFLLEFEFYNFS
jgi:hypothetical protein